MTLAKKLIIGLVAMAGCQTSFSGIGQAPSGIPSANNSAASISNNSTVKGETLIATQRGKCLVPKIQGTQLSTESQTVNFSVDDATYEVPATGFLSNCAWEGDGEVRTDFNYYVSLQADCGQDKVAIKFIYSVDPSALLGTTYRLRVRCCSINTPDIEKQSSAIVSANMNMEWVDCPAE